MRPRKAKVPVVAEPPPVIAPVQRTTIAFVEFTDDWSEGEPEPPAAEPKATDDEILEPAPPKKRRPRKRAVKSAQKSPPVASPEPGVCDSEPPPQYFISASPSLEPPPEPEPQAGASSAMTPTKEPGAMAEKKSGRARKRKAKKVRKAKLGPLQGMDTDPVAEPECEAGPALAVMAKKKKGRSVLKPAGSLLIDDGLD